MKKTTTTIDTARVELLLSELRLPGIKLMWSKFAEQADSFCLSLTINVRFKMAGRAARFLATLAEHEMADRARRRIERHLAEARLPRANVYRERQALTRKNARQLRFRSCSHDQQSPGDGTLLWRRMDSARRQSAAVRPASRQRRAFARRGGKSHLAAAIGLALVENGWRVLFMRTTDLVQRLAKLRAANSRSRPPSPSSTSTI